MQRNMYERVAKLALPPEVSVSCQQPLTAIPQDGSKRKQADAGALNAINALKKICNHPQLMYKVSPAAPPPPLTS